MSASCPDTIWREGKTLTPTKAVEGERQRLRSESGGRRAWTEINGSPYLCCLVNRGEGVSGEERPLCLFGNGAGERFFDFVGVNGRNGSPYLCGCGGDMVSAEKAIIDYIAGRI